MDRSLELAGGFGKGTGAILPVGHLALSAADVSLSADVQQLCIRSSRTSWAFERRVSDSETGIAVSSVEQGWL